MYDDVLDIPPIPKVEIQPAPKPIPKHIRDYMARLGRKGGRIGGRMARGDKKRQSPEHYVMLTAVRKAFYAKRREAKDHAKINGYKFDPNRPIANEEQLVKALAELDKQEKAMKAKLDAIRRNELRLMVKAKADAALRAIDEGRYDVEIED